jgi:ubiquinone/menaquinone biosynthesis C-methylase UbiE
MDTSRDISKLKRDVRRFWEEIPCGTRGIEKQDRNEFFRELERERYEWEPYIREFARFEEGRGKRVLEVGIGAGTDFINWVRQGAIATGVDLTEQGVALTRERLSLEGLAAEVHVADAESLPFSNDTFDLVYSYGVLHHSPNTARAIREVHRVLRRGGVARVMIYHSPSWTGLMLWLVHCAAKGKPWRTPRWAMYHHLESPGTKSYGRRGARHLFSVFSSVSVRTQLSHGDLLLMRPSEKYRRLQLAWRLYPRGLVRLTGNGLGTGLMIQAVK